MHQVIYSSSSISWPSLKPLAVILYEISYLQNCTLTPYKGHNSARGDNSDKKKIRVSYFLMRNPYMKFQNPSFKFFLNGRTNKRTNARTDKRTDKPKAICSPLFQSWGHNQPVQPQKLASHEILLVGTSEIVLYGQHTKKALISLHGNAKHSSWGSSGLKVIKHVSCCWYFDIHEQDKFHAQLS